MAESSELQTLQPQDDGLQGESSSAAEDGPIAEKAAAPFLDEKPPSPVDFRSLILQRLQQRDAKCRQFEPVFSAFNGVVDDMLRARHRRVSRTESAGPSSVVSDAQLEALRLELADVYRKKSINDQHLLEANRTLDETRKRLDVVTKQRDDLVALRDKLFSRIAELEVSMHRTEEDRQNARDEFVALSANFSALAEKVQVFENERIQLLDRIMQLQEKEAAFYNMEVDQQTLAQQERIRAQIEAALQEVPNGGPELVPIGGDASDYVGDQIPVSCAQKFEASDGEVTSLAWLGTELFAAGGSDKIVRVYRVTPRGQVEKTTQLVGCNQSVTRLDWDASKRNLLAASNDHTARMWNLDTARLLMTLSGHTDKVSAARFLKDSHVVTGSFDRTLKVFDVRSGKSMRSFFPGSTVLDVAAYANAFISGHMDRKVRVWDGRSAEPVRTVEMGGKVTSIDVAYDDNSFVCSMRDDTLAMVDLRSYAVMHIYGAEQYRTASDLSRCVLSPTQEFVAAGSADGPVFVWRATSTKLESRLSKKGHETAVGAIAWNPSGRGLISADRQKQVCLWL